MYDEDANLLGRAKHVMVALGHGPLTYPGAYGKAKENPEIGDRIVQAYEPKTYYPGGRYVVLGSGIAAVNEWVNVLEAGASCIALRRNPEPDEQDLNVPRCLFDGSGIDAFSGLSFDERVDFLGQVLKGTAPQRRNWAGKVKQAQGRGPLRGDHRRRDRGARGARRAGDRPRPQAQRPGHARRDRRDLRHRAS